MTSPCPKCNQVHDPTKCTGHNARGLPCGNRPIRGGTVCSTHGGSAPQVKAAAQQRQVEAAAQRIVGSVWNPDAAPVTNAVEAMQQLAGRLQHAADVLGARLDSGQPPCEACGRADLAMDSPAAVAWLRVLREDRQLLEAMERLGIAERFVQLEADQVRRMAAAVGLMFEELKWDREQREAGTRVLMAALRAETGTSAIEGGAA